MSLLLSCNNKERIEYEKRIKEIEKHRRDSIAKAEKIKLHEQCVKIYGGIEFGMTKEQVNSAADKQIWEINPNFISMTSDGESGFKDKLYLKETIYNVYVHFDSDDKIVESISIESRKTTANHLDELQEDCLKLLKYFFDKYKLDYDIDYKELKTYEINDGETKTFIRESVWPFYLDISIKQEYDSYEYSYRFYMSKQPISWAG